MNATEVARILHEVSRVKCPHVQPWEKESADYRATSAKAAGWLLEGRISADALFHDEPALAAVVRACLPPVFDINDEPEGEPDRKPGYSEKFVTQDDPAKRERMKPGPCETITA